MDGGGEELDAVDESLSIALGDVGEELAHECLTSCGHVGGDACAARRELEAALAAVGLGWVLGDPATVGELSDKLAGGGPGEAEGFAEVALGDAGIVGDASEGVGLGDGEWFAARGAVGLEEPEVAHESHQRGAHASDIVPCVARLRVRAGHVNSPAARGPSGAPAGMAHSPAEV